MRKKKIEIIYTEYSDIKELPDKQQNLIYAARKAVKKAYAPYSKFKVGAALLMDDDSVITGSNQENASSPVGSCAERTALYWANANFPEKKILAIAITSIDNEGEKAEHLSPCGLCRQTLMETQQRFSSPIKVFIDNRNYILEIPDIESLLPLSFSNTSL